jgi:hypothetical protein
MVQFGMSLLLLLASAVADARSPLLRQKPRELQGNPCAVPFEDVVFLEDFFTPSYVESCLSSKVVDERLMNLHIASLQDTFRQFYCFYNIAKDPAASDPLSFQKELNYTLFSGPLEGQVNMDEEFKGLLETVATEGAALTTFWDIHASIDKLRDAHIYPIKVAGLPGDLLFINDLVVFPERARLEANTNVSSWTPRYNDVGELELQVTFSDASDGTETSESIVEINGMTPYNWYYDLASKPSNVWPSQAHGARMNEAFKNISPKYGKDAFTHTSLTRPSDWFPDSFTVKYASGDEEIYYTGFKFQRFNASNAYEVMNSMTEVITKAGKAFENFAILVDSASNVTAEDGVVRDLQPARRIKDHLPTKHKAKKGHEGDGKTFEFDEIIEVKSDAAFGSDVVQVGITIMDDYAVLKVPSFVFQPDLAGETSAVIGIWSSLVSSTIEPSGA